MLKKEKASRFLDISLGIIGAGLVLFLFLNYTETQGTFLMDYFIEHFFVETSSENAVTAIYLNYRVFDTIFEALMLLVCVMEVLNASGSEMKLEDEPPEKRVMNKMKGSEFLFLSLRTAYPFMILLGAYLILAGHLSPGGGFQGGTVLATVLISHYIVSPKLEFNLEKLEKFEMIIFLFVLLVPAFYVFMQLHPAETLVADRIYMVILNTLIGLKVFAGLTIIFYWFVFYEAAKGPDELKRRNTNEKFGRGN